MIVRGDRFLTACLPQSCSYEKQGWLTIRTAWTPFAPADIQPGGKYGTEQKVKAFYAEESKKTGGKVKFTSKYKTFVQDLVAQVRFRLRRN